MQDLANVISLKNKKFVILNAKQTLKERYPTFVLNKEANEILSRNSNEAVCSEKSKRS